MTTKLFEGWVTVFGQEGTSWQVEGTHAFMSLSANSVIEPAASLTYDWHMPRIRREIPAVKIEYVCDRCERGIYRLVSMKPVTLNYVHKWQHRCTHCGDLADFTLPYPLIEVDGKPVSRAFILREALPTPRGPSSQAFSVGKQAD
jgi:hypothetical protein